MGFVAAQLFLNRISYLLNRKLHTNTTNCAISLWMQASICLVPRRVYVGKIFSSIAKDLRFDWLIQVTWKQRGIVNQIHLRKRFLLQHIRWYSSYYSSWYSKYSSCHHFLPLSGQVVSFYEADYYCIILSRYLRTSFS